MIWLEQVRRILPVDVLEQDGQFTRGYVQAIFEGGDLLINFDRKKSTIHVVKANHVFGPVNVFCPGAKKNYRRKSQPAREFKPGDIIEVLLQSSSTCGSSWYPANVIKRYPSFTIISVDKGPSNTTKMLMHETGPSNRARFSSLRRDTARFVKFQETVPEAKNANLDIWKFMEEWERTTGTVIMSVDRYSGVLTLVSSENNPLAPKTEPISTPPRSTPVYRKTFTLKTVVPSPPSDDCSVGNEDKTLSDEESTEVQHLLAELGKETPLEIADATYQSLCRFWEREEFCLFEEHGYAKRPKVS